MCSRLAVHVISHRHASSVAMVGDSWLLAFDNSTARERNSRAVSEWRRTRTINIDLLIGNYQAANELHRELLALLSIKLEYFVVVDFQELKKTQKKEEEVWLCSHCQQ